MLMNLIQIELLLHYDTSIALGISIYAINTLFNVVRCIPFTVAWS